MNSFASFRIEGRVIPSVSFPRVSVKSSGFLSPSPTSSGFCCKLRNCSSMRWEHLVLSGPVYLRLPSRAVCPRLRSVSFDTASSSLLARARKNKKKEETKRLQPMMSLRTKLPLSESNYQFVKAFFTRTDSGEMDVVYFGSPKNCSFPTELRLIPGANCRLVTNDRNEA